jgi:hypothetical protein
MISQFDKGCNGMNTGARYEIAIDGTTRTYRDRKNMAIEAATS